MWFVGVFFLGAAAMFAVRQYLLPWALPRYFDLRAKVEEEVEEAKKKFEEELKEEIKEANKRIDELQKKLEEMAD